MPTADSQEPERASPAADGGYLHFRHQRVVDTARRSSALEKDSFRRTTTYSSRQLWTLLS